MRKLLWSLLLLNNNGFSQTNITTTVNDFKALLSVPNIASDSANIRKNTTAIMDLMTRKGISNVQLLSVPNSPAAIYGEVKIPGATKTLVFYAHYDGQPVSMAVTHG